MITISGSVLTLLQTFCNPSVFTYNSYSGADSSLFNYSNNNTFNRFLSFKVDSNGFELPVFGGYTFCNFITNTDSCIDRITVSLVPRTSTYTCSNSTNILKGFTGEIPKWYSNLNKILYKGSDLYYGNRGIILDAGFRILVLLTLECNIDIDSLQCYRYKMYLHPSVMVSDRTFEKFLRSKLLPYICSNGLPDCRYITTGMQCNFARPSAKNTDIIITDVTDRFIYKVKAPSVFYSDKDINRFLKEHTDSIGRAIHSL